MDPFVISDHSNIKDLNIWFGSLTFEVERRNMEEEVLGLIFPVDDESSPVSRFSLDAEPKSKAVPGVLGVFVAEPNEAKAPDPGPNAFEAPAEGDDTPPVRGEMALKGFDRPCALSGPKRFDE